MEKVNEGRTPQEMINYKTPAGIEVEVPVFRTGVREIYAAVEPPEARPYLMAPHQTEVKDIAAFFEKNVATIDELREDMKKRFAKGSYGKCRFQTGDVAYVMGRPFQLRVFPLGEKKMKSAARGRATAKYSLNADVSLLTLYVVHPKNYDEARLAFNSYAENIITRNANSLEEGFASWAMPGEKVLQVRMRDMRGKWVAREAGSVWISSDIIPYPPECLVYVLLRELEEHTTLSEDEFKNRFESILPTWEHARQLLADRPEPYCLQ